MFESIKSQIFDSSKSIFSPVQKEALKFLISCLQYHSEWRTMETSSNFKFSPNIEELALLIRRVRNRENFLPYPITGNWADKLVQLESQYAAEDADNGNLFESLELTLKKLLKDEWLTTNSESDLSYLKPLTDFLKSNSDEQFKFDIFSLNNDTVIEHFFQQEGEVPWRGFSNGKWSDISPDDKNDPGARVNLYKLHGSIDWVRLEDMDTWEEIKIEAEQQDKIDEKHNPYIIFGQGTKSFSVEPFFSLIHHFNKSLNSSDKRYIFVVGYSFFDPYINNLLFNAIKGYKKLIIVNPGFAPSTLFRQEKVDGMDTPEADSKNYFRVVYEEGQNESSLTDFLREIQKNSFYSELPEFNFLSLSAENLEYLPLKAEDFVQYFFSDNGRLLKDYIDQFETQRQEEEPF
ncbi:SIR2 family protein [Fulvivirga sp.]|uniref:SIR2 family protein n=1 Tax=Fulvivirga sp. TaxID=1931237 RepID=UPI0032EB867E